MISPDTFIRQVHPLLAFAGGLGNGAVSVNNRLIEKRRFLLLPDLQANGINNILQYLNLLSGKTTAEIARCRGVGYSVCANSIKIDLIIPQSLYIFKALAVTEDIVSHIEDMVGLKIGVVQLEKMETAVDGLIQSQPLSSQNSLP